MNKPDAPDVRKAAETALDLFVYAPVGLVFEARSLLPKLAQRGRNQIVLARFGARFARQRAEAEAERVIRKLHAAVEDNPLPSDVPLEDVSVDFDDGVDEVVAPTPTEAAPTKPAVRTSTSPKRTTRKPASRKAAASKVPTPKATGPAPARKAGARNAAPPKAAPPKAALPKAGARKAAPPKAALPKAALPKAAAPKAPASKAPAQQARRTNSADALPISGYDTLSASQVLPRLTAMTGAEREAIGAYEASHRGRRTILNRVAQLQS